MCRNCPLPQWSEPIEVEVSSLPAYFAKEQSWNFERLNFGNGTVIDTEDGKSARPSITGLVGCRLRDGFSLKPHPRFPGGRYLLVSEVLYCPGRRYGCTPRDNCSGKRRFCHALCKLSIFADKPNIAFVYYAGSHGTGDVSSPDKHRPNKQMLDELRRLRIEQALTPSQGIEWCKVYFAEHGLDEKQMPTKQQIKSVMKRASMKFSRMRETGGLKSLPPPSTPPSGSSQEAGTNISAASLLAKYTQLPYAESGDIATDASTSYISVSQDGSTLNVSSANYSPGGTPVSLGTLSRLAGTSLLNAPVSISQSTSTTDNLSKVLGLIASPRPLDGEKDTDKLKEHIRILQEENFSRIAQIADLQVEVNNLKAQVLDLKEDNLKKAIHIAQIERERRSAQIVSDEEAIENSEPSLENAQETIQAEGLVDNSEQTVVIEESQESAMDVIESEQAVENTVYQQEVCDTPITVVNVQTGTVLTEVHAASQSIEESLHNSEVVAVNVHAIVSQAVVDEQL
ncbi:Hypothetical predicted protein [Paramuricea clavata]|uniref:Uncharacterized protein n=1 Tax=Paramuricea clavata TaxID=317549 RepID=A0A6S7GCQ9_PARCT|nr:Hypothetical predicted protein [Paramuricea clavata]